MSRRVSKVCLNLLGWKRTEPASQPHARRTSSYLISRRGSDDLVECGDTFGRLVKLGVELGRRLLDDGRVGRRGLLEQRVQLLGKRLTGGQ
jgi:hypothetical protein